MSSCPRCGSHSWLCQQCKLEQLEAYWGTPADRDRDHWVLGDRIWHAGTEFDGSVHTCLCGVDIETPLEWSVEDLRHVPDEHEAPVCRDCVSALDEPRRNEVPDDATFDRASELCADGGRTEAELVDRAVREATDLVASGDSLQVAVGYVVDEHEITHRHDDIRERVQTRLEEQIAADGGVDYDDIRQQTRFFVRRAKTGGAEAMLHLPAEGATREQPAVKCKYNARDSVSWRVQEVDATPVWQLEKRGCSECFETSAPPNDDVYGRNPSDVLREAGFDVDDEEDQLVTDGGRDLEGRDAFLAGDAHWCDICQQSFDAFAELVRHDCPSTRTDGGADQEPGSIENRLTEIDKQAGIILEDLDEVGLEPTTRLAVEGYLGTIQFYIDAVETLLEHDGLPDDDSEDDDGTSIAITDGGRPGIARSTKIAVSNRVNNR